jgi:hypothetical protein
MNNVMFVIPARRRVCPQGLLLACVIVTSASGLAAQTVNGIVQNLKNRDLSTTQN